MGYSWAIEGRFGGVLQGQITFAPHIAHGNIRSTTQLNRHLGVTGNVGMRAFPAQNVANVNAKVAGIAQFGIGSNTAVDVNAGVLVQGHLSGRSLDNKGLREYDPINPIVPILNVGTTFEHGRNRLTARAGTFIDNKNKISFDGLGHLLVNPNTGPSAKLKYTRSVRNRTELSVFGVATNPQILNSERPSDPSLRAGFQINVRLDSRSKRSRFNFGVTQHRTSREVGSARGIPGTCTKPWQCCER